MSSVRFLAREPRNPGTRNPGVGFWVAGLAILCCFVTGCEFGLPAGNEPHRELNFLDMADQPKLKPQRADLLGEHATGMLEPPAGSVAVDDEPYLFTQEQGELAAVRINPLDATPENIARGKWVFENICITCHGPEAAGDGHLTKLFPEPPSLMTQKIRDWSDGRIFHLPMRGQGSMPSHAGQIGSSDIWSVILYIRSLQDELPVAPPDESQATDGTQPDGTQPTDPPAPETQQTSAPAPAVPDAPAPEATDSEGGQP